MTKTVRHIIFLLFLFQLFGCDTEQNKIDSKKVGAKTENIFGLYSYYVTGYNSHCETVKHSLRLDQDSTFVLKVYCYADSTSPFISTIKSGRWAKQTDSIFQFTCSDTTTFDIALLFNDQLKIIRPVFNERMNFSFSKDTTKDEMFWQKQDKNLKH
jgi:hypothetical protein